MLFMSTLAVHEAQDLNRLNDLSGQIALALETAQEAYKKLLQLNGSSVSGMNICVVYVRTCISLKITWFAHLFRRYVFLLLWLCRDCCTHIVSSAFVCWFSDRGVELQIRGNRVSSTGR